MEQSAEELVSGEATELAESGETAITARPTEPAVREAGTGVAPRHRRQEKVGLVTSDKMQKTVVVRVDRQVRPRKYERYIRRRTKFLAHDELGAHTGDIVRIVETR